jgi:ADP-dependent NAD(P)H-hydrate dehydratase / NAD(P)H-hydrate epimerase
MKIFKAEQIRAIDAATIATEPVSSVDLMERAAGRLYEWVTENIHHSRHVAVFAGPGNNGGDALALARMMTVDGYSVKVFIVDAGASCSNDFTINLKRLHDNGIEPVKISDKDLIPEIEPGNVIIDGIFGSGLSRPPSGIAADVIKKINDSGAMVISIDIPSGLSCDGTIPAVTDTITKAHKTLSFQFPKLPFMFDDCSAFTGEWKVLDIGLLPGAIAKEMTPYFFTTGDDIASLLKKRDRFDHKGVYGHALIIAGSYGKAGAAILAGKAALRTGAGLVTCHAPGMCVTPVQASVPEVMVSPDEGGDHVTTCPDMSKYDAVGIGPGIGTDPDTRRALATLLASYRKPVVIDADALNILSLEPEMLSLIPENSVLTPHPGEFARLTGKKESGIERMKSQVEFARRHKCVVLLKGAFTSVATPDGIVRFNSTGNPGMATAGSGDVLTGMITSLIAMGYSPENAAVAGVFLHGLAGDLAVKKSSVESLMAGDIIKKIGKAYMKTAKTSFNYT